MKCWITQQTWQLTTFNNVVGATMIAGAVVQQECSEKIKRQKSHLNILLKIILLYIYIFIYIMFN